MSGKTRNIAIKLVLQQCCKASCVFLARFNATFVRVGASKWHGNTVLAIQFFETLPRCPTTYDKSKSKNKIKGIGPVRESNPGPLAPKARIMPLDQQADDGGRRFVIVL